MNLNEVSALKHLPALPPQDHADVTNYAIYNEVGYEHSVCLWRNELTFFPQIIIDFRDSHYSDEFYCYQSSRVIFNFDQLRISHDRELHFLASDYDDPDEEVELAQVKEFKRDFTNVKDMFTFLHRLFSRQGFKKYKMKPYNLDQIWRNLADQEYLSHKEAA